MSTPNDPLNFFVLEASECLERLDAVLAGAGPAGPDAAEFVRFARSLRGAALMHRQHGIADLAAAVERAGRALRDGGTRWSPALAAALVAAVDDLKILLHNVRIWGPNEEARAKRRLADLERYAPASADAVRRAPGGGSGPASAGLTFLAQEAAETAAALETLVRPGTPAQPALAAALARVRILRGVAAVHDVPPIPDVLDAVERLARSIEAGQSDPTPPQLTLFATAASLLRRTASDVRLEGRVAAGSPEEQRFMAARDGLAITAAEANRIVPITELFYADGRAGVVAPTSSPPTTPAERFRLEVVSMAEHLRALVREAQAGGGGRVSDRLTNQLRAVLLAVRSAAESFGERGIADLLRTFTDDHPVFDLLTLHAVDEVSTLLADPIGTRDLAARLGELTRGRALDVGIAHGLTAPLEDRVVERPKPTSGAERPSASAPRPPRPPAQPLAQQPPAVQQPGPMAGAGGPGRGMGTRPGGFAGANRGPARTPTGPALQALLADGIAGISPLADIPLAEQPMLGSAPNSGASVNGALVPIEALLYRGTSALARARALRDALRADTAPTSERLAELYDLLDLASSA
jgi:hypothetical protein